MGGYDPLRSLFRRPRPEGRWSLAHPLREPIRAIAQSLILWPAAALAAIMAAAPQAGVELLPITRFALQITVLYPLIATAGIGLHYLLARVGFHALSPLPLIVPLAIVGLWAVLLILFLGKFAASMAGLA